jgi:hypothetical protein
MHETCRKKIRTIQQLATFLREAAPQDRLNYYAKIMNAAAADLDEVARSYAEQCSGADAKDDAPEDHAAALSSVLPSPSAFTPPFATPTIAGRSSRSCST